MTGSLDQKDRTADEAWPTREMMAGHQRRAARVAYKAPPRPASPLGLTGLLIFALLAAFFAWVTAEPLWLAVGHGRSGTASAIECSGHGIGRRCVGDFTPDTGTGVERVALLGVDPAGLTPKTRLAARMVGTDSGQVYTGAALHGLPLRWVVGLILALLCGAGIALTTGALRFRGRIRLAALTASLAAPLLLLLGFLAATY